ncbi:MAG TPA: type II toxin-antitoxin system Phd/YefM family antitoxin [Gemmatimonadaceae bacterium]|jgi:prevent-host-death family protein|nr:type II toxin-antitoxin system Phd/YefM family antitoxin [Gemmatimonadaceae bacterium]
MLAARDVRPITYLKNSAADLIREVSEEGRTVLITQHGEAKVVVMDVARYDEWRQTLAWLKLLAMSKAEHEAGHTVSTDEAFALAEAELAADTL